MKTFTYQGPVELVMPKVTGDKIPKILGKLDLFTDGDGNCFVGDGKPLMELGIKINGLDNNKAKKPPSPMNLDQFMEALKGSFSIEKSYDSTEKFKRYDEEI